MKNQKYANSKRQKVDQRSLRASVRGWNGELLLNVYRVSVWDDERVMEINSGDGYATL